MTKVVDGAETQVEDPTPYNARVSQRAIEIYLLAYGDRSPAVKALNGVTGPDTKVFTASVLDVVKEQSSTRGLVTLKTKVTDRNPDGTEKVRTERTDDPMGLAMARKLKAVIGHRVVVFVEVEPIPNHPQGHKVRVIRHFEDLGPDSELSQAAA
jgi:hypothetical protein